MAKILMKGNEAFGRAAIEAGCHYFFGYPITPQSRSEERRVGKECRSRWSPYH